MQRTEKKSGAITLLAGLSLRVKRIVLVLALLYFTNFLCWLRALGVYKPNRRNVVTMVSLGLLPFCTGSPSTETRKKWRDIFAAICLFVHRRAAPALRNFLRRLIDDDTTFVRSTSWTSCLLLSVSLD